MKRILFLASLMLLLAACSGHTVHRVEIDLLSYVPEDHRSGTLDLAQATVRMPEDPAGQEVSVPGSEALLEGSIRVRARVQNTGSTPASLALEVRMGPKNDTDLYDGTGGDFQAKEVSLNLNPGEEQPLALALDIQPGSQAHDLIRSGAFRIGARLSLSGEQVRYTLEEAGITLRLKLFNLIPSP
ncbi:hypothetical protein FJNA_02560 [Thermus sp. FJN-A]